MKKKIVKRIILGCVALLLVVVIAASNYLFEYAIARKGDGGSRNVKTSEQVQKESGNDSEPGYLDKLKATKEKVLEEARLYFEKNTEKEDFIETDDGLKLKLFYLNEEDNNKWVLLIHGYRADHKSMHAYAEMYHRNGYNVLMPDLRASGESEGQYIGMGILDKNDMKKVLAWILNKNANAEIIVHGNSMGAATTMLLSGEKEAEQVKAFVEDSGYTDVYKVFKSELNLRFGLPSFPLLDVAEIFCKLRAGYGFRDTTVVDAVAKSNKPILFIHGERDNFIPFSMMDVLYEAKKNGKKGRLVSLNAGHVESLFDLGDAYEKAVMDFIK